MQFTDGRWQDTPSLMAPVPCDQSYGGPGVPAGNAGDFQTISYSLQPQPDGTLSGAVMKTILTNECGFKGSVFKTPFVATRIGDVPPSVVLVDPALFQ